MKHSSFSRRRFLSTSLALGAGAFVGQPIASSLRQGAPAIVTSDRLRPIMPNGIQAGDVTDTRAIVWSRSDRPARMVVEWATNDRFTGARTIRGPVAAESGAFTAAVDLRGLPAGERISYRVRFESLRDPGAFSEPVVGAFRTAPRVGRRIRVAWSGDTVGQGWGIDPSRGGLRMFDTIRRAEPDVFINSGDIIYADNPLVSEVPLPDGTVWRNLVTEAKSKVAETLDEFRGNFAYNLLDEHARRFNAEVPTIAQWDDHEVCNNWYPGLQLVEDSRFTVKDASLLASRAKQALFEFLPIRRHADEAGRIYRRFSYGPLLEIFVVDLRSYRGTNNTNQQTTLSAESMIFGTAQMRWLKAALRSSRAVWKVIACDMPIGLVVSDTRHGQVGYEAVANAAPGAPLGRELEVADLLAFMKRERIRNTVWVTTDVHYAAAHHFAPERAGFADFDPFWEFVAGPLHAGNFGPNPLDMTFGPEVRFTTAARGQRSNRPPSDNLQYYGTLDVDPRTRALTAGLHDVLGTRLWQTEIPPAS